MANLQQIVSRQFTNLTATEQQIYQTLLKHTDLMYTLTITELAELAFSSKSSILRFVKKLGFQGFSDFKYSIDWASKQTENPATDQTLLEIITSINTHLTAQKTANFSKLIHEANLICLIATGEDQNIQMQNFARMLLKRGLISSQIRLNPNAELTTLVLDRLTKQDLLIVFSSNGNSKLLKQYLFPLVEKKIDMITITAASSGWLSKVATLNFSLDISPKNKALAHCSSGLLHLLINLLLNTLTD